MLDYGDIIYRSEGKGAFERLDVLYHSAIRFTINAPYRTHHCTLYSSVNWSSLCTHHKTHWLMLIYKTLLGLTPPYLRYLPQPSSSTYNICSANHILLKFYLNLFIQWLKSLTLLLTVVAALRDVLLSLPSCPLCCCLCPIMFVPCCCHGLLPCYVVVLGLFM